MAESDDEDHDDLPGLASSSSSQRSIFSSASSSAESHVTPGQLAIICELEAADNVWLVWRLFVFGTVYYCSLPPDFPLPDHDI